MLLRRIKKYVILCGLRIIRCFPIRNIIIFESVPDCGGNTGAVFNELIRRGVNNQYKIIWWIHNTGPNNHKRIKNVTYLKSGIRLLIYQQIAKMLISENYYQKRQRENKQYSLHILHAGSVKRIDEDYYMPKEIDEVITLSPILAKYDAENNHFNIRIVNPLGFPRNDVLLDEPRNPHELFVERTFSKLIYWMPTYRQHKDSQCVHSSITIPFLDDEQYSKRINDVAKEMNILIVVKPHFAQDTSKIRKLDLSNIVFIDEPFLQSNHWESYELLRSSNALITDYSSVYYDYLLTDNMIGLCWVDFKEYQELEGFAIDMETMMVGGEKIYNVDNMCEFIKQVANNDDKNLQERQKIKKAVFPYNELRSTSRVADRIEAILSSL